MTAECIRRAEIIINIAPPRIIETPDTPRVAAACAPRAARDMPISEESWAAGQPPSTRPPPSSRHSGLGTSGSQSQRPRATRGSRACCSSCRRRRGRCSAREEVCSAGPGGVGGSRTGHGAASPRGTPRKGRSVVHSRMYTRVVVSSQSSQHASDLRAGALAILELLPIASDTAHSPTTSRIASGSPRNRCDHCLDCEETLPARSLTSARGWSDWERPLCAC